MKTDLNPLTILVGKQRNTLRRVETIGKALIRLEGTKVYWDVYNRHQRYLASLASLTLAIEAMRREEGKDVKVLGV
jgi:hypothetical protein